MNKPDFDALLHAPSIDLYRLRVAIDQMLTDPARILEVRRHLHLGAQVMYFDDRNLQLAPGRVLQLQGKYAVVQDEKTRVQWRLPYVAIVPGRSGYDAAPPPPRPGPAEFRVGDTVSFTDKHLRERFGTITRLNAKTCSLLCDGEQWRVSPGLLRKVIDV